MIAMLPIILLLLTAFSLIIIRLLRPGFRYPWLVMMVGSSLSWAVLIALKPLFSAEIEASTLQIQWGSAVFLPIQLSWAFDPTAWGFSLAVITIWLASLLTSVARSGRADQPRISPWILASGAVLSSLLMLAVTGVHLISLGITWAVVDLCELTILIASMPSDQKRKDLAGWIVVRFISLSLVTWAAIGSAAAYLPSSNQDLIQFTDGWLLSNISPAAAPFLILAAMLRIGSFPPFLDPERQNHAPEPLESLLKFASIAPALALLVRVSQSGSSPASAGLLLIAAILALFYAGFGLAVNRANPSALTTYWISGSGALVAAAAIRQQPAAAQAAGIAFLLAGSMLQLFSIRPMLLSRFFWIVAFCLTGLIFTPTWPLSLLHANFSVDAALLLLGHSLLAAGYLQQIRRPAQENESPVATTLGPERWLWLLYIGGLILLFATLIVLPRMGAALDPIILQLPGQLSDLLPGVLVSLLAFGFYVLFARDLAILQQWGSTLVEILQLEWLTRLFGWLLIGAGRLLQLPNLLLEGQAGLIWALLVLVLLLTIFSQIGTGG